MTSISRNEKLPLPQSVANANADANADANGDAYANADAEGSWLAFVPSSRITGLKAWRMSL